MQVRTAREARDGRALLAGEHARAIARSMGCSPTTVTTARDRWLAASEAERGQRGVVRATPAGAEVVSVGAERRAGAGDPEGAREDQLGADAVDVADRPAPLDVLEGAQASRRQPSRRGERRHHRRYEWTEAGALLHIDAFALPKFERPGHWATGQRAEGHRTRQAGRRS